MAQKKLADAGFDEGNYTETQLIDFPRNDSIMESTLVGPTPLVYFCYVGDIKMVRYLLTKNASVHAASNNPNLPDMLNDIWYPMYAAVLATSRDDMSKNLAICKLLHENGCEINRASGGDSTFQRIGRRSGPGKSPLVWPPSDAFEVRKWFILNGGLLKKSGEIDDIFIIRDIPIFSAIRSELFDWARQAVQTHDAFHLFMLGTLAKRPNEALATSKSDAALTHLSGNAGALECIADFVGVVRGKR